MVAWLGKFRLGEHGRQAARGDRSFDNLPRQAGAGRWLAAASATAAAMLFPALPAHAQWIECAPLQQPLIQIPEIVSQDGRLRGTILLTDERQQRLSFVQRGASSRCAPQRVRYFQGLNTVPAGYPGLPPQSVPSQPLDPVPGPTLRARVGDLVQLTFLNQIDPNHYGDSIDRGERGQGCDESTVYPGDPAKGGDVFPDCFHGSSTGNIHFHGTHTNPSSTGDNIFLEVRPSLRKGGQPIVTEASVKPAFDEFFRNCDARLKNDVLSQWPRTWSDLPAAWTSSQESLLKTYDGNPAIQNKLWPVNAAQLSAGVWPQYYIGAYPYCFRLPLYAPPSAAQSAHPPSHTAAVATADQARALQMGQAPGTHWYHAHKHGSTAINVANGMTGVFIIEGPYDDAFDKYYGTGWTRRQPVLVINQLGVSPNLMRGPGPHQSLSVNGRLQPKLTMRPGEVQLWRIANTSSRSGVFLSQFAPPATPSGVVWAPFQWKQTAQDGVQFAGVNYQNSTNPQLLIASGNRVDLLVKAPAAITPPGQPYALIIQQARSRCETLPVSAVPILPTIPATNPPTPICQPEAPVRLLFVEVAGSPVTGNETQFIPADQLQASFPAFLADIPDQDVKATKTIVFESLPGSGPVMHTIDGTKFDGNVGQVVLLNTTEEWKIVNRTVNGGVQTTTVNGVQTKSFVSTDPPAIVDHPFHIHINPFQIVEFFDPNEVLPGTATSKYIFSGTPQPGQCLLDINKPETWKPCDNAPQTDRIWWDVFSIPSARAVPVGSDANLQAVVVPGYFKMRSRFVDFTGQYVIHCHILAHEDRGMMTIVQVVPFTTPYSHK
jgi:FtsP/CotA-like multicopper oxidase with cupredoxin domain